jgi:hypothetical protein
MTDQSFSVEVAFLSKFAQELQTQVDGIAAPMNQLATQSGTQPQFGAFTEAWLLGQSQQTAIQEMYDLIGQVKQAIGFAQNVTNSISSAYQKGDQDAAASFGAPGPATVSPSATATSSSPSGSTPAATAPSPPATTTPPGSP